MTTPKVKSLPPATFHIQNLCTDTIHVLFKKYGFRDSYELQDRLKGLHRRVHAMKVIRTKKPSPARMRELLETLYKKSESLSKFITKYTLDPTMLRSNAYELKLKFYDFEKNILKILNFDIPLLLSGITGKITREHGWINKIDRLKKNIIMVRKRMTLNDIHQVYYIPLIEYMGTIIEISEDLELLSKRVRLALECIPINKGREMECEKHSLIIGLIDIYTEGTGKTLVFGYYYDKFGEIARGEFFHFVLDCMNVMGLRNQSTQSLVKQITNIQNHSV